MRTGMGDDIPGLDGQGLKRPNFPYPDYFNPRPPHGERPANTGYAASYTVFQSTLPARGATPHWISSFSSNTRFQSTLPAWGATRTLDLQVTELKFQSTLPAWGATTVKLSTLYGVEISIHAPRMGSDCFSLITAPQHQRFQSTLPAWGAT